jgi:hypothetical protein
MSAPPKDIVERIRGLRYVHVPVASELMAEAATAIETLRWQLKVRENIVGRLVAENERLRNGAVAGCETVCPHVRGTVTQHCSLNFTLTDEEREAIEWCLSLPMLDRDAVRMMPLRSLLERLK